MALFAQAIAKKSGSTLDLLRASLYGRSTAAGRSVNVTTAIQVSTVFACCRVLGEGLAQVPLKLLRESGDDKIRLPAKDHPLYALLSARPNDWQTSFEYREMLAWHVALCGEHFSFISRNSRGKILELVPFDPGHVTVTRATDNTITYTVRATDGEAMKFPAAAIWHVRGPSWNSYRGMNAVELAREAIGLGLATEEAAGRLHANGVRPSGIYTVEGKLQPDQYKTLSDWIHEHAAGAENTGKPLILDRAAKWTGTQMTGIDAQALETRRFQIEEICRFFRVMPIMVGYSDKAATYASAEQMFLAHVVHTLAPWYERLEQSIDANLLTASERESGLYSCFIEEGLLRGSMSETKDMITGYVNGGIMTVNEGRAKLDMNPDADPASDKLRIPANIVGTVPDNTQQGAKP